VVLFLIEFPDVDLAEFVLKTEGNLESLSGYMILGVLDRNIFLPRFSLSMDYLEILMDCLSFLLTSSWLDGLEYRWLF
jgi:hypothetical protein